MTAIPNSPKTKTKKEYISSRAWAEDRIKTIKSLQDEYLDMYVADKKESVQMLKLLTKIQALLEKKLQ